MGSGVRIPASALEYALCCPLLAAVGGLRVTPLATFGGSAADHWWTSGQPDRSSEHGTLGHVGRSVWRTITVLR
jgi:hypothetical protein